MKADDMAKRGYFSHTTPDGKNPWYWLNLAGYKYSYAGENLAVNFIDSKDVNQALASELQYQSKLVNNLIATVKSSNNQ